MADIIPHARGRKMPPNWAGAGAVEIAQPLQLIAVATYAPNVAEILIIIGRFSIVQTIIDSNYVQRMKPHPHAKLTLRAKRLIDERSTP